MKIGFIGLGVMGGRMAKNFLKAGHQVVVSDVVQANVDSLVEAGAVAASSIRELAQAAEIVFTSLPNGAIVRAVLLGEGGLFEHLPANSIVVDLSSIEPDAARQLTTEAHDRSLYFADAPVSGGIAGAEQGTLTIMVGAAPEVFEKIDPLLANIGKKVFHVGPPGAGQAMKMINNMLLAANMASLAEALVLGQKQGLSFEMMRDIISVSSGNSYVLSAKMNNFILKNDYTPGFTVDLQYKDLGLAIASGRSEQMPLPMANAASQVYELARANHLNNDDISVLVHLWQSLGQKNHD